MAAEKKTKRGEGAKERKGRERERIEIRATAYCYLVNFRAALGRE